MSVDANRLDGAVDALRAALGADAVLEAPAAAELIDERSLNRDSAPAPRYIVRPSDTEQCRKAVEILAAGGSAAFPIASLTTFWEPPAIESAVVLDTLLMCEPFRIDPHERIGYFGTAATVREVDRAARSQGLCLLAYPDSDGSQSVGSIAAVACTTGLGLGHTEPVDQIAGLTVVTPDATVVRTGTAWRLGHGGVTNGAPDPTGVFLGSQGRSGVITEVVLKLSPAPFLAAHKWTTKWTTPADLAAQLRRARECLDLGTIDSLRLETICAGNRSATESEWFLRCWAPDSSATAEHRCGYAATMMEARDPVLWVESEAARRGGLPDYDQRYDVPPGEHQVRTGRDGFLGIEVNVNWGSQLDAALPLFASLSESLGRLAPGHRRLGIYPSAHAVSIGMQAMLTGGEAKADAVRAALAESVEPLAAIGAVPYRAGRLWRTVTERREAVDPAYAIVRRCGPSGST